MEIKAKLTLWVCLFLIHSCVAQKSLNSESTTTQYDINTSNILVEIDNLGRLYLVTKKNIIINYKPDLVEKYRYANQRSGDIASLDVTNPLKITAFYDDFNQVRFFDNSLSVISELNLSEKFADLSACGMANDGNLWVFDPVQFKLIKITDEGNIILETTNVNDFGITNANISIIREKGNFVVLVDKMKGFYFFDNLGQYMYQLPVIDVQSFQFDGTNLFYFTSGGLKVYSVVDKEIKEISTEYSMPAQELKYILYSKEKMYYVYENGIKVEGNL